MNGDVWKTLDWKNSELQGKRSIVGIPTSNSRS